MTGILNVLAGAGSPDYGGIDGASTLRDVRGGANAICGIQLNHDGSITPYGNQTTVPARWHKSSTPPMMWATNTLESGSTWVAGSTNGPLAEVGGGSGIGPPLWQWLQSVVGSQSATGTIRIYANAAGTQLAVTITYTVFAQRTS